MTSACRPLCDRPVVTCALWLMRYQGRYVKMVCPATCCRTSSTSPSSRGLGRGPFKAETRVRIPVGTPSPFGRWLPPPVFRHIPSRGCSTGMGTNPQVRVVALRSRVTRRIPVGTLPSRGSKFSNEVNSSLGIYQLPGTCTWGASPSNNAGVTLASHATPGRAGVGRIPQRQRP